MKYIRFFSLQIFLLVFLCVNICRAGTVEAGYGFTLFTDSNNTLWAFGKNDYGQLGIGKTSTFESQPVNTGWHDIYNVRASGDTTFILRGKKTLYDYQESATAGKNLFQYYAATTLDNTKFHDSFYIDSRIDNSIFSDGLVRDSNNFSLLDFIVTENHDFPGYRLSYRVIKGGIYGTYLHERKIGTWEESVIFHSRTEIPHGQFKDVIYQKDDYSIWLDGYVFEGGSLQYKDALIIEEDSKVKKMASVIDSNNSYYFVFLTEDGDLKQMKDFDGNSSVLLDSGVSNFYHWQNKIIELNSTEEKKTTRLLVYVKEESNNYLQFFEVIDRQSHPHSTLKSGFQKGDASGFFNSQIMDSKEISISENKYNPYIYYTNDLFAKPPDDWGPDNNISFKSYGDHYNYLSEIDDNYSHYTEEFLKINPLPHIVFRKSDGSVWGVGGNNFKQIKDSPKKWFDEPVQIYPFEKTVNYGGGSSDQSSQDGGGSTENISELRAAITELENRIVNLASKDDLSLATDAGRRAGINEVLSNPTEHGLTYIEVLESSGATPHTNGWFFQPEWGGCGRTSVFRMSIVLSNRIHLPRGYFKENSSPPYFFNYETEEWEVMGE